MSKDLFKGPTPEEIHARHLDKEKSLIFCSKCQYHRASLSGERYDKCAYPIIRRQKNAIRAWTTVSLTYCSHKNNDNDCCDFKPKRSLFSWLLGGKT